MDTFFLIKAKLSSSDRNGLLLYVCLSCSFFPPLWKVCAALLLCTVYWCVCVCRRVRSTALPLRDSTSWIHGASCASGPGDSPTRWISQVMCTQAPTKLLLSKNQTDNVMFWFLVRMAVWIVTELSLCVHWFIVAMHQVNDSIGTRRTVRRTADSQQNSRCLYLPWKHSKHHHIRHCAI